MDRRVQILIMSSKGHAIAEKEISKLDAEEIIKPGYIAVVNGRACYTWEEVLRVCQAEPEPKIFLIPQMAGG